MIKVLLWPFAIIWSFVGMIFKLLGCMVASFLGLVLIIVGIVLTITVVGALIGVPMIIGGIMLMVHSIFG